VKSQTDLDAAIADWETAQEVLVSRWNHMLEELKSTDNITFPMIAVALRELLDLAQASRQS